MSLFDFLKPKKNKLTEREQLLLKVFPGGPKQIHDESKELQGLLPGKLSLDEWNAVLAKICGWFFVSKDTSFDTSKDHIIRGSNGKLNSAAAYSVYKFMCAKRGIQPMMSLAERQRHDPLLGSSDEYAIVVTKPNEEALQRIRQNFRGIFAQWAKDNGPQLPPGGTEDSALDAMISEFMKERIIETLFGKKGVTWKFGLRAYLKVGAIQSQEIVFLDKREPTTLYFDFSQFGGW